MHQMSPGVERAVEAAKTHAARLGDTAVDARHLLLALLDEDEGRPALLVERAGLSLTELRRGLESLGCPSPQSPTVETLFAAARSWSIRHRHDPEFLTDAFFIAVLRSNTQFETDAARLGLHADRLEQLLTGTPPSPEQHRIEPVEPLTIFGGPETTAAMDTARIMDANFNRAREAARVLEDYCRFVLSDRFLTGEVKQLRHAISAASRRLTADLLLAARDTADDVGKSVTAAGEYDRESPAAVARANLKRLQESIRTLEEFGKLHSPALGRELEAVRYKAYTLERAVEAVGRSGERIGRARLYVLLTGAQCSASLDWTIAQAAAGGADVFQLREKTLPDQELIERARNVRKWTREAGVLFIVNDRPDIARLSDADGVHLGQDDLRVSDARRVLGPNGLIGVSTHSVEQVRRAVLDGADYIGVGPVFPSRTKSFDAFPGPDFVRAAVAETGLPAFALGGIEPGNVAEVVAAGARRIAVGSAITTADNPAQVARLLRSAVD